jgi:CheY-like chemotaxis protein
MDADARFQRRILLVDSDAEFIQRCSAPLRSHGYEVLTASDGFGALRILRGAHPDLVITELDLQHMSGFELLSVVRTRFPNIAMIVLSSKYTPVTIPHELVCDVFLAKSENLDFELTAEVERLISESPIRGSRPKATLAPVWIPTSDTGYIILTCPECLRSFSAEQPATTPAKESCIFCAADVYFQVSSIAARTSPPSESLLVRSRQLRAKANETIALSKRLRDNRFKRTGK